MSINKEMINSFLAAPIIAVAGASRNPKKFGYMVLDAMKKKGIRVLPVNPETDTIGDLPCYRNVAALPSGTDHLLIVTPKTVTLSVMKESLEKGILNIWVQQMSETPEVIEFAKANQMNLVYGKCILMFLEPVQGFHKFHRTLLKLFGRLPK